MGVVTSFVTVSGGGKEAAMDLVVTKFMTSERVDKILMRLLLIICAEIEAC